VVGDALAGRGRHGHVPAAAAGSLLVAGQISGRARAERASKQMKARVLLVRAQTGEKLQHGPNFL
jgi:hypothetical protein